MYKVSIRNSRLFRQFKDESEALSFIGQELDYRDGKRVSDNMLLLNNGTQITFVSVELLDKVINNIRRI